MSDKIKGNAMQVEDKLTGDKVCMAEGVVKGEARPSLRCRGTRRAEVDARSAEDSKRVVSSAVFTSIGKRRAPANTEGATMLLILAVIVGIAWLLGFAVFHVAGGAMHLLLLVAVVGIIVHFVRASRRGGARPLVR